MGRAQGARTGHWDRVTATRKGTRSLGSAPKVSHKANDCCALAPVEAMLIGEQCGPVRWGVIVLERLIARITSMVLPVRELALASARALLLALGLLTTDEAVEDVEVSP